MKPTRRLLFACILLAMGLFGPRLLSAGDPSRAGRTLGDLLQHVPDSSNRMLPHATGMKFDEESVAAAGIRRLRGKHITLYTDLPSDEEVDRLVTWFDQGFDLWCDYFGLDRQEHRAWHITGVLMDEKQTFRRLGLFPEDLPPFLAGYARNDEIWLYEQPSAYYRRHLLLHEGVHAMMNTILGGCGPPWYMEGMAEMLATHRIDGDQLVVNVVPRGREEVPDWGRIWLVKNEVNAGRMLSFAEVRDYGSHAHVNVEPYGWSWTAAILLDRHPRYRDRFRQLQRVVRSPQFHREFDKLFGEDLAELSEEWDVLAHSIEYGHDVAATTLDFSPAEPLPADGKILRIEAARGWQNSKVTLEAGREYLIEGAGRYQVADVPQPWPSEPGGVSIRYYRGRPLGMLLGAIRPDTPPADDAPHPLTRPIAIGLKRTITPEATGTLYLKINDSPGELHDNAGTLAVRIR